MSKVIVERPRLRRPKACGSHYPRGHLANMFERDLADAPSKLGMSFPHKEKCLNENLAPLRRWLRSQVGRPWSAVRGELRAVIDARSATQLHVLQHVADYVVEDVTMVGGVPHYLHWSKFVPITSRAGIPLWVSPQSGLLRDPPKTRKVAARFGKAIRIDARTELRTVDGVWRTIELAPMPAKVEVRAMRRDVLLEAKLEARWFDEYQPAYRGLFGRLDAYAVGVRPPGKRELATIAKVSRRSTRR